MSRAKREGPSRKLIDHIAGPPELGPPRGLLATSFDLQPEFVEVDFLPSLLHLPAWDDWRIRSRVQLEAELAKLDGVCLLMEARRFQGRPRSLRVDLRPASAQGGGVLHAKVTLIVHDDAVRLLVASANLTTSGYRENREVAFALVADSKHPEEAALLRDAFTTGKLVLRPWWSAAADRVWTAARSRLDAWAGPVPTEERFLWGGAEVALWRQFVDMWPAGEPIRQIRVVSPFWSEEHETGPLPTFVSALRERSGTTGDIDVSLITSAATDTTTTHRPSLPSSYATFDFRRLGMRVRAVPAQPRVDSEDVGRDDVLRERALHAKVVLVDGVAKTKLVYAGSANFTGPGWGFARGRTNVEAGIAMVRRGKEAAALEALVPATTGEPIALDGSGRAVLVAPVMEDEVRPWPRFLRGAELAPSTADPKRLELVLELEPELTPATWELRLETAREPIPLGPELAAGRHAVALGEEDLRLLLRKQVVYVAWEGLAGGPPIEFPVNVAPAAREQLPFGDPDALPSEGDLVAFYQGRIAIEEMYPETEDARPPGDAAPTAGQSSVDTSKILSYQVRSFIEALPGLRDELARNAVCESSIRLALVGPVSPVALAREIEKAALAGRSTTAAAFQLVELVAALRQTKRIEVPARLADAWVGAVGDAETQVQAALDRVRSSATSGDVRFATYMNAVLGAARKGAS